MYVKLPLLVQNIHCTSPLANKKFTYHYTEIIYSFTLSQHSTSDYSNTIFSLQSRDMRR